MSDIGMKLISVLIAVIMTASLFVACGMVQEKPDTDVVINPSDLEQPNEDTQIPTVELSSETVSEDAAEAVTEAPKEEPEFSETAETAEWMNVDYSQKIVDTAIAQLGVPFEQGGDSPEEGFDSTGFVYYCVNQAGIEFPRSLADQLEAGEKVGYDRIAAGDLVYFSHEIGGEAKFCGVYVGGGLIIYSPVPDEFVKTANITTNYWVTHFVTGLHVSAEK